MQTSESKQIMAVYEIMIISILLVITGIPCQAQEQVGVKKSNVGYSQRPNEATPITNASTGQRMTMEQYGQLSKEDPYAYHLVPDYDEFGLSNTYTMRQATAEEHETHRYRDRDPAKQPKAGQPVAPFVMTALDGKTYRSTDLLGKVVILTFLVSLEKTFWSDQQTEDFVTVLKPYQLGKAPVSLAVLNSEQTKDVSNSTGKTLPFMPVPNAYGFHNKYHITSVPTFIVIDKTGKVAANIQGAGSYEKLKQVLVFVTQ